MQKNSRKSSGGVGDVGGSSKVAAPPGRQGKPERTVKKDRYVINTSGIAFTLFPARPPEPQRPALQVSNSMKRFYHLSEVISLLCRRSLEPQRTPKASAEDTSPISKDYSRGANGEGAKAMFKRRQTAIQKSRKRAIPGIMAQSLPMMRAQRSRQKSRTWSLPPRFQLRAQRRGYIARRKNKRGPLLAGDPSLRTSSLGRTSFLPEAGPPRSHAPSGSGESQDLLRPTSTLFFCGRRPGEQRSRHFHVECELL